MKFPEFFGNKNDDYIRYIKQRAKLQIEKARGIDVTAKLKTVNGFIYSMDKAFTPDSIEKFDLRFEESCMHLRQHTGNGKDIKNYTVTEYYVLLKILEKQNKKKS